ncbi:hypothetical protein ACFL4U_04180 [Candidatus Neomarinimicrobiota bacterium]
MKKTPDGKGEDFQQLSSEPVPGLLKYRLHPSKLLSMRAVAAWEKVGTKNGFVVRLVREMSDEQ